MKKLATIITLFLAIGCGNILVQGISFIAFITLLNSISMEMEHGKI